MPTGRAELSGIYTCIPIVQLTVWTNIDCTIPVISPRTDSSVLPFCIGHIRCYGIAITVCARLEIFCHPNLRANSDGLVRMAFLIGHSAINAVGVVHIRRTASMQRSSRRISIGCAEPRNNNKASIAYKKRIAGRTYIQPHISRIQCIWHTHHLLCTDFNKAVA